MSKSLFSITALVSDTQIINHEREIKHTFEENTRKKHPNDKISFEYVTGAFIKKHQTDTLARRRKNMKLEEHEYETT